MGSVATVVCCVLHTSDRNDGTDEVDRQDAGMNPASVEECAAARNVQETCGVVAERVGFEPTCPLRDKTLSRRPRYDHFGTSPVVCGRSG